MGSGPAFEAMAVLRAARDAFAAIDQSRLTVSEKLALYDEYEELTRQLPAESHRILAAVIAESSPRQLGAKTWNEVLRTRWRLSSGEAGLRLGEAADLAPRQPMTGPPLAPRMPAIAAAQALGFITGEQVALLRDTLNNDLPHWVDTATHSQVEVDLVKVAVGQGYEALRRAIRVRLFQLDQDGPDPEAVENERRRKRGATKGKQGPDGLTAFTATLDAETAAMAEVLFAKFAAPGMCNREDEKPCYSGTPTRAQIDNDHRTVAQRQHDALKTVFRIVLMADLGKLNGLPVSIIIRTTLQDLESRGIAITGGGTLLSMDDVDRLGEHAYYHLCVFDKATGSALNHFRGKRVATAAQRAMLIAQHGVGCTKPGCTVDAHGVQAHHAVADWAADGQTNVDEMAPACGGDNRIVGPGGYITRINDHGECEWIPPEHLDNGQDRVNIIHRPEALLAPADDVDETTHTWPPNANPAPPPHNNTPVDDAAVNTADDTTVEADTAAAPGDPWVNTHTDTPEPEPVDEPEPYSPFAAADDDDETRTPRPEPRDDTVAEVHPIIADPGEPIPYELTHDVTADPNGSESIATATVLTDTAEAVGYGEPPRQSAHSKRDHPAGGPAPPT